MERNEELPRRGIYFPEVARATIRKMDVFCARWVGIVIDCVAKPYDIQLGEDSTPFFSYQGVEILREPSFKYMGKSDPSNKKIVAEQKRP